MSKGICSLSYFLGCLLAYFDHIHLSAKVCGVLRTRELGCLYQELSVLSRVLG